MKQIIVSMLFCYIGLANAAQTNHFQPGKQEYDDLNLSSALKHFENAYIELLVKNQSKANKHLLAETLLYQAATYFFLMDFDTAKRKITESLTYEPICSTKELKLPDKLLTFCKKGVITAQKKQEDENFRKIIDMPAWTIGNNLQATALTKKRLFKRDAGLWVLGLSAVPFGMGIGFGIAAFQEKQNFKRFQGLAARNAWRTDAIIADTAIAVGTTMLVTGLVMYLLNLEPA